MSRKRTIQHGTCYFEGCEWYVGRIDNKLAIPILVYPLVINRPLRYKFRIENVYEFVDIVNRTRWTRNVPIAVKNDIRTLFGFKKLPSN